MKTASQISTTADALKNVSDKLVTQEFLRNEAIDKVKNNTRLSDSAKAEELARVSGMEVLTALHAQVDILKAELDAGKADWDNLAAVLRAAALPLGGSPAEASVMGMLRDEALALEADPAALQSAMVAAALEKNWTRVYSLALGRLDENGMPLSAWQGVIQGVRFDCLDMPGQVAVMDAIYRGQAAFLAAEAAWQHASSQSDTTTQCMISNLAANVAKAKFDREARMLLTPAEALRRAEDERTAPGDRYERLPDEGGLFAIFDHSNGVTRFVDQKTGPGYLKKLNDLTRISTPAEGLPMVAPVTGEN